jgi:hypothetical protein
MRKLQTVLAGIPPSFALLPGRGHPGLRGHCHGFLLIFGVLFFAAACSPRDFLTRRLAADLIASSDTFKSTEQFGLHTGVISNKDYISPEYLVLQRHGWITGAAHACPADVAPPPCWQVALTPIGVDTFHDLISNGDANASYFGVPVARRQLIGISGISRSGPSADIEFLWKWVPLNEVGAALYAGGVQYRSTVGFRQYDDGWRVLEGSAPKNDQSLDDALKNSEPAP